MFRGIKQIGGGMAYKIFVSYSSKDSVAADLLKIYLGQIKDIEIFLFKDELLAGQLSNAIAYHIGQSDIFIVIYSKNSHTSTYVQQEIGVAKGMGKLIIPILIDKDAKPDAMLQGVTYLPMYDPSQLFDQAQKLYNFIALNVEEKRRSQAMLAAIGLVGLRYLLRQKNEVNRRKQRMRKWKR